MSCHHPERDEMVTLRLRAHVSVVAVPEISRFYGIIIRMYHREHLPPHLHAEFGAYEITVEIRTCDMHGRFPVHAFRRVRKWVELHREELLDRWRLARDEKPLPRIPPLE
jgi:hypothetical protein